MREIRTIWNVAGLFATGLSMTALASAATLFAAGAAAAQGQSAPASPPQAAQAAEPANERIVVRGRRMTEVPGDLEDYVSDFVGEVAAPPRGAGYARFDRFVCVGAYNLENSAAQYVVDRVSALALEVGLTPDEPGCAPNVLIVFAENGAEMARAMVESDRSLFRPGRNAPYMQRGFAALDDFVATDAPVRWWHVSLPVDRSGNRVVELPGDDVWSGIKNAYSVTGGGGSRLYREIRDALLYTVIVVDVSDLDGAVTWEELADYVALVSLAQVDPNGDTAAFDSILNLFDNPDAYSGLTDWDRSFVHALYSMNPNRHVRVQPIVLINEMARNAAVFANLPAE